MSDDIDFLTFKEHAQSRSMWKGSAIAETMRCWCVGSDGQFTQEMIECSPALRKCFDEILVNAADQVINTIKVPLSQGGPASYIKVSFDNSTGEITIRNDGRGMPVYVHPKLDGKYTVEGLTTKEYSGSNFKDKENPDRVTGGVNGLGMKLINIDSKRFIVETVDVSRHTYYKQVCENRMDVIHPPTVIDLDDKEAAKALTKEQKESHTTIRFIPDYDNLCKKDVHTKNSGWANAANLANFERTIKFRIYQLAAFLSSINYRYCREKGGEKDTRIEYPTKQKARIYYNGTEIKIRNLEDYASLFGVEKSFGLSLETSVREAEELENEDKTNMIIRFPWYIAVGINANKGDGSNYISVINGIFAEHGGSHVTLLYNKIFEKMRENIMKIAKIKEDAPEYNLFLKKMLSLLKKFLFIVDCKQIPVPQFGSQTKEALTVGAADLNVMKRIYNIPDDFIKKLWNALKDAFKHEIVNQLSGKRKKNVHIRKYEPAEHCSRKDKLKCALFIPEGDSAAKPIFDIINSDETPIDSRYYGVYNIQGVPMNAQKSTKDILIGGEHILYKDTKLLDNVAFNGLMAALNLDYNCDYYLGSDAEDPEDPIEVEHRTKGQKEFEGLNYGSIIIATDQDVDGIGQICSLILVFFVSFWPELIKRGFVKRLATPIIRVYEAGKDGNVTNYYSEKAFEQWAIDNFHGVDNIPKKYTVKYYKGLATHTEEEVIQDIGKNILYNIYTYRWDEETIVKMNTMYGKETQARKRVLSNPEDKDYKEKDLQKQVIPCSDHFSIEALAFQLYFIRRKLKSAVDGFIPVQRKAFAAVRVMFNNKAEAKVYQVTGYATKKMRYPHGDSSMNEAIIKMAQSFTGTNNIPAFTPISNGFGDRRTGRGETGSPRYINMGYNARVMDIIFPREDDYLLPYNYEEGEQCEPLYYVPIVPYSILETSTTTSAGWKIGVWARDFSAVMWNLRLMINSGTRPFSLHGKPWLPEGMRVVTGCYANSARASEICLGSYTYNPDTNEVFVSQLPLKVWSYNFKCNLLGIDVKTGKTEGKNKKPVPSKELVTKVLDKTASDKNRITIKLKPGAYEQIEKAYGTDVVTSLEDYLGMTQQMLPQINMVTKEGGVREFKAYEEVMEYWFPLRKHLYEQRLIRNTLLHELRILYYENILRFIELDSQDNKEMNIDDKEEAEREQILEAAKFLRFNKTNLFSPKYIKNEELRAHILEYGASYAYIDEITIGMKSEKGKAALRQKLEDERNLLLQWQNATWKGLWLEELAKLEEIVQKGVAVQWNFNRKKHKFRSADRNIDNNSPKKFDKSNKTNGTKGRGKNKGKEEEESSSEEE